MTAGLAGLLLVQAPAVFPRRAVSRVAHRRGCRSSGLDFSFFVDGLGLFFAGLILGIGLLIIVYARCYLAADDPMGRFYAYLLLFQGAMLGIVLSRQHPAAAGVLGADQPHLLPADRLSGGTCPRAGRARAWRWS